MALQNIGIELKQRFKFSFFHFFSFKIGALAFININQLGNPIVNSGNKSRNIGELFKIEVFHE